ncbi:acyl--CoA ligase [Alphaproteobacteria bacterium]|nr:acyl--CoA ligase [Alphaproteobacteria bacterium]
MFSKKIPKKNSENIAVTDNDKKFTYQQTHDFVLEQSHYFHKLGLKKGDRVCLLFENSWPLIIYILVGLKDGIIIVPLNPKSSKVENKMIINDCSAKAVFFDQSLEKNIPSEHHICSVKHIICFDEKIIFNDKNVQSPRKINVHEEDTAFILYTSGTTGKPKGAMITNFNIIHSCLHFKRHFELSEKDNCILVVPASHVTGLIAHIMTILFAGGNLILMKAFDVKEFLHLADKEKLTYLIMVPAMYNLCLHRANLDNYNLKNWRIGCFGGAPMPIGTIKKLRSFLPNMLLVNAYGSTETCSPATLMTLDYNENLIASVGKIVETGKILIMGNNKEVRTDEIGELWISGPMVIPGYWNDLNKTSIEFVNGYWKSGDIGYKDKNNYIYILDRKKDVINRGGYNIYSSEIENLLSLSGLIVESAVIPQKDPILGEKIHAIVYASRGSQILDSLQKLCKKNLSEYKQPDYWTFVSKELPKNKNGKVLKSLLIEEMKDKF